jgi:hypothetical protein
MFRRAWWQGFRSVWSDEGYRVRLSVPTRGLQYTEGNHVLRVHTELSTSGNIICINSVKSWLPPHQDEKISEEKRRQIQQRVIAALDFLKVRYVLPD